MMSNAMMHMMVIVLSLVSTGLADSTSSSHYCGQQKCVCHQDIKIIYCERGDDLKQIPKLEAGNYTGFDFELASNKITQIKTGFLPHGLRFLSIQDNRVFHIDDTAFLSVNSSLQGLFLTRNRLTRGSIENVTFPSSLTSLSLDSNPIGSIPSSAFADLTKLEKLGLGSTQLTSIDGISFPSSLTELSLSNNPVTSIPRDAFKNLVLLTDINLSNTQLTRLPRALSSLTQLIYLHISGPNLTCTCTESGLATWYHDRSEAIAQSDDPGLYWMGITSLDVTGKCDDTDVGDFLQKLAPQCPKS